MTCEVLCPWCGSKMWYPDSPWERQQPEMGGYMYKMHGKCRHCEAMTPAAYGRTPEEAVNAFFAAALSRYEPPVRPLTLEEAYKADHCYLEHDTEGMSTQIVSLGKVYTNVRNERRVEIMRFGQDVDYCTLLECADYGKTWRCWPRKPTDEERQAAEWEDAEYGKNTR